MLNTRVAGLVVGESVVVRVSRRLCKKRRFSWLGNDVFTFFGVLPFPRQDDVSVGHPPPSITLFTYMLFTSNNADKQRYWARAPSKISSTERSSHRNSQPSSGSGTWSLWYYTPATSQSTSTYHYASIYVHKCHSTTSGISTSQSTRLPELCPIDAGIETVVLR